MRSLRTATKSSPHLPQLEKARAQQRRPNAAKKKKAYEACESVLRSASLGISHLGPVDFSLVLSWLGLEVPFFWSLGSSPLPKWSVECVGQACVG